MMTFLQILLAVALVIMALIFAGWIWIRHKIKKFASDFGTANELIESAATKPARMRLQRATYDECSAEMDSSSREISALGFSRLADFEDLNGSFGVMQTLVKQDESIACVLIDDGLDGVDFVFFFVTDAMAVVGIGTGPGESVQNSKLDWQLVKDATPETALDDLRKKLTGDTANISLGAIQSVVEQVYALQMDRFIANAPSPEEIERRAFARNEDASKDQVDQAYEIVRSSWLDQVEVAVLDRYRRKSKIDAVTWETMEDQVQVVHDHLSPDEIEDLLVTDNLSEKVFEQAVEQSYKGIELFQQCMSRLPPEKRWRELGVVDRPVRSVIFCPDETIESNRANGRPYVYEASDEDGNPVAGSVVAKNGQDAMRQISRLDLQDARLVVAPAPGDHGSDDLMLDDKSAAIAARACTQSIGRTLLMILASNWWIWGPPAFLTWRAVNAGLPYTWGDYAIFVYALLAGLAMFFVVGPSFFYHRLLSAQLLVQPKRARVFLFLLKRFDKLGGMTEAQLLTEHCKILAMEGSAEEALEVWGARRHEFGEEVYLGSLVQICDAAGHWQGMIAAQRSLCELSVEKDTATIDLAMSLARHTDDVEEVQGLVQSIQERDLPEVARIGYDYVAGLLAAKRGNFDAAVRHYATAVDTASQFDSVPIMNGLIAEINGYAAISIKHLGDQKLARQLWDTVWPILRRHRIADNLLASWEAA